MKEIELEDALSIVTELARTDEERMAVFAIKESVAGLQTELNDTRRQAETYRHLFEGIQKRLTRFRDVAARPDIPDNYMSDTGKNDTAKNGD